MRVQERPKKRRDDVLQAELEMRVLIDGVVPAVERRRADVDPLLFGNFLGPDDTRRIARARRGDRRIIRVRKGVSQRDARRRGFDGAFRSETLRSCGLWGHCAESFYNGPRKKALPFSNRLAV